MGNRKQLVRWTVDYGDGEPISVRVPHAWRQDVDVRWEGPATYALLLEVPPNGGWLHFMGASYRAEVKIDGETIRVHEGIWDAFDADVSRWAGRTVRLTVEVTKNGGLSFPVRDVLSGFLPYVFHTFGGLHGEVFLADEPLAFGKAPGGPARALIQNGQVTVDGLPIHFRGLLHWGWYPELGHPNPPEEVVRDEVRKAKALGFNLVKFCLWVPPSRYFEILEDEGMFAWLELPLWDPSGDPDRLEQMEDEIERIVLQTRRHPCILFWTVGCELSTATPPDFRKRLVDRVASLTNFALVKDNSGGAEMYGGDLREFGDFWDFHPYCDTPFFGPVLESLMPNGRAEIPVLLGETNDIDVHRDLPELALRIPYWASNLRELNDQGVRWQYDLPAVLESSRFVDAPDANGHAELLESSRRKALFMRKLVVEQMRSLAPISGYVLTGWRDTPISTAGFFDDWGKARFSPEECLGWNGPDVLFLLPTRRPPWVRGGNRPGWRDGLNHYQEQAFWRVGLRSADGGTASLGWKVRNAEGRIVAKGVEPPVPTVASRPVQIGEVSVTGLPPGRYVLEVDTGNVSNSWAFHVHAPVDFGGFDGWRLEDPDRLLEGFGLPGGENVVATRPGLAVEAAKAGHRAIALISGEGSLSMPFWRESAYQWSGELGAELADDWERLLPISGDVALDPHWIEGLGGDVEVAMLRVDTRTYAEHPVLVRVRFPSGGEMIATTLRPQGGLGSQPYGIGSNPSGSSFFASLMR